MLVVGFDLDMTLVDSAAGIVATVQAVLAEHRVQVDAERIWALNGVPLEATMARLAPGLDATALADRYRALYPELGVPATRRLPGAREALAAVGELGGRTVVVSAKIASAVALVLETVGLDVDEIVGGAFAEAKGEHLRRLGAQIYVGDHPGDVRAARAAGALAVAVATGPHPADRLRQAGADLVLTGLGEFVTWLGNRPESHPSLGGPGG